MGTKIYSPLSMCTLAETALGTRLPLGLMEQVLKLHTTIPTGTATAISQAPA